MSVVLNNFIETSYANNAEVASFSPELHQPSQPLDQGRRNFCHKQLVRKAVSVTDC
jgi:hypothetical protein